MHRKLLGTAFVLLMTWSIAWADSATESAQQKLKDEGFYYGEVNGRKDVDTTAALRRYQIRHGLQITGELNAETQRSLGLTPKPSSKPTPRPAQTPGPTPPGFIETPSPVVPPSRSSSPETNNAENRPGPPPSHLESANLFSGTPYESAPPSTQQDIVSRAQLFLTRQGYYGNAIDGIFRPALSVALRNYQARFGLRRSGRLDVETLASLSLLPEQRTTGFQRFRPRSFPSRMRIGPGNEPVYIPR